MLTTTTHLATIGIHDPRAADITSHTYLTPSTEHWQGHLTIGPVTVYVGGTFASLDVLRAEAHAMRQLATAAEALAEQITAMVETDARNPEFVAS